MTSKLKRKHKRLSANSRDDLRFVKLDYFLLKCEAFREVSGGAFKLYLKVRERYNGLNNGTISFSVREAAEELGITPTTGSKYFRELTDKGFLRIKQKGSYNLKTRHATLWIITAERYNNKAASNDFMSWIKHDAKK